MIPTPTGEVGDELVEDWFTRGGLHSWFAKDEGDCLETDTVHIDDGETSYISFSIFCKPDDPDDSDDSPAAVLNSSTATLACALSTLALALVM